ncbi:MAG: hypothetical protein OEW47_12180 [Thermoleophilia bacterium]|nr:hypothetical protein [Thermoleophilia bacterium]
MSEDSTVRRYLDPRDREYVATLEGEAREVVVSAVLRYRHEDRLRVGDPLPLLSAVRLENGSPVSLAGLTGNRPLVLVFGSFT